MSDKGRAGRTTRNRSSGQAIAGTPIYSTSKSAVSALTEVLHLQLTQRGARIRASVLYPGPHIVTSNIFTARRNRPAEFEREVEQAAPPITLETIQGLAKQAGMDLQTTTPEAVADAFFEGLQRDAYFMLPASEEGDARIRERMLNVLKRRNPEPLPF